MMSVEKQTIIRLNKIIRNSEYNTIEQLLVPKETVKNKYYNGQSEEKCKNDKDEGHIVNRKYSTTGYCKERKQFCGNQWFL